MADVPHLIDLQDVGGMSEIEIGADTIKIGALVTQSDIIDHAALADVAPILREAALQIADPQVRYMDRTVNASSPLATSTKRPT